MDDIGYFIDIERFTKWLYQNKKYVGDTAETFIRTSICKYWLRYEKFPNDRSINDINDRIQDPADKFEKINIADLLICVNNAVDINRGQVLQSVTSTGKKVMLLILMGRILDGRNKNGFFTASKQKDTAVWEYLATFNNSHNKKDLFYYYPGRTFSLNQLMSIGKTYKNGIKDTAIPDGIRELIRVGLVSCVNENEGLYKLDFNGCKKFLEANK